MGEPGGAREAGGPWFIYLPYLNKDAPQQSKMTCQQAIGPETKRDQLLASLERVESDNISSVVPRPAASGEETITYQTLDGEPSRPFGVGALYVADGTLPDVSKIARAELTDGQAADCVMLCTDADAPFASARGSVAPVPGLGVSLSASIAISPPLGNGSNGRYVQKSDGGTLPGQSRRGALQHAPTGAWPGGHPDTAAGAPGGQEGSVACWARASEARRRTPDLSTTSEAPGGQDGQAVVMAHSKGRAKGPGRKARAKAAASEAAQSAKRAADDRHARMLQEQVPLSWLVKWIEPALESALQAIDQVPLKLGTHPAWEATRQGICKAQSATRELLRSALQATSPTARVDMSTVGLGKNWLVPSPLAILYDIYCMMLWICG